MLRLFFIIHSLAATVLAGSAIVAVLTMGLQGGWPIIAAAALGTLAAVPVAFVVTRQILS